MRNAASIEPKRFLFAMFQGGGNTHLILPVVGELVSRGHDVRILVGPGIRPTRMPVNERLLSRAKDAGARLLMLKEPVPHPLDAAPPSRGLLLGKTPRALGREIALARMTAWSEAWADQTLSEIQRETVDVLAADFHLPGAMAAGEVTRVPTAALVHNIPWRPVKGMPPRGSGWTPAKTTTERVRYLLLDALIDWIHKRDGTPAHNKVREGLGLPRMKSWFEQYDRAARVLVFTNRAFDFQGQQARNVRYVGTPFDDLQLTGADWASPWSPEENDQPLVLVSLSTLPQGQGPLLGRTIEALGRLQVKGVVTVGPALDQSHFVPPPNVRLYSFIPHAAVLPHVQAMVTQCGIGTLSKALAHGVPLVCIPFGADQPDNAARVRALNAGVVLPNTASVDEIMKGIMGVLSNAVLHQGARDVAALLQTEDGAKNAASELESISEPISS